MTTIYLHYCRQEEFLKGFIHNYLPEVVFVDTIEDAKLILNVTRQDVQYIVNKLQENQVVNIIHNTRALTDCDQNLKNIFGLKHRLDFLLKKNIVQEELKSFYPLTFNLYNKTDNEKFKTIKTINIKFLHKKTDGENSRNIVILDNQLEIEPIEEYDPLNSLESFLVQEFIDITHPPVLIKTQNLSFFRKFHFKIFFLLSQKGEESRIYYYPNLWMGVSPLKYNIDQYRSYLTSIPYNSKERKNKNIISKLPFNPNSTSYIFDGIPDNKKFYNHVVEHGKKIIQHIHQIWKNQCNTYPYQCYQFCNIDLQCCKDGSVYLLEVNDLPGIYYSNMLKPPWNYMFIDLLKIYMEIPTETFIELI